jgi:hypothetical protein
MKKMEVLGKFDHHNTNITLRTLIKQYIAILRLKINQNVSFSHHINERSSSPSQDKNLVEFCSRV